MGGTCARCGAEIPSGARFCPSCAKPVSSGSSSERTSIKRNAILAAIVVFAIIVAVAFGFVYRGGQVTRPAPLEDRPQAPLVQSPQVPAHGQPNLVQSPPNPPIQETPQPPQEVLDYLKHLEQVEKARQEIAARELNDLVAAAPDIIAKAFPMDEDYDDSGASHDLSAQAGKFTREWQDISAQFLSKSAPASCGTLARAYYDALREFISFMMQFQEATERLDVARLRQIKREQVRIDEKLKAADAELAAVCKTFGIDKSFKIQSDTGQTPLLGF